MSGNLNKISFNVKRIRISNHALNSFILLKALHFTFKNEGGVRSTLLVSVLHSIFFVLTSKHLLILSLAAPNLYHYDTAVIIRILIQTSRQSFISRISNSYFQVIFVPTFSTCFHRNLYFLS